MRLSIIDYSSEHSFAIRQILERIGWAEQYIAAAERNAELFSRNRNEYGVYLAVIEDVAVGFVYVQFHEWNQLAELQGLAVDPSYQRHGIASKFVEKAESFALGKKARGIHVNTPTLNQKGRSFYESIGYSFGYEMPRFYEDELDGVTYQKFFAKQ